MLIIKLYFVLTKKCDNHINSIVNLNHATGSSHKSLVSISKRRTHTSSNLVFLKFNKHAKVNFKNQLILISKRSFRIESNTERLERERSDKVSFDFYSGKNIKKRKILNNSLLISKKNNILNFLKKILISNTSQIILTILGSIILTCIFITLQEFSNKFLYLDISFVEKITSHLTKYKYISRIDDEFINFSIFLSFETMQNNEYVFYIRPDTVEFLESKIKYQKTLKTFSEILYWEDFEDKREGLNFLTTFYEHYFKIAKYNNESILAQNITK